MQLVEWRAPWRGLLVCALLGGVARIHACAPEYPQSAPRLAWVGDGYLAVWADRDGDMDVVRAAKLSATGAKRTRGAGRAVWRTDELQSRPLLAGGGETALVVALEGPDPDPDPDEDRSDPLRFLAALPLGADGRELGEPRTFELADRICATPTWDGARFAVGFGYRMRYFGDDWLLQLAGITADGRTARTHLIASGDFGGCAVARHGDALAIVVTVEDRTTRSYSIRAYLVGTRDYELLGPPLVLVDGEERPLWPDVVAERDGWAVSFADHAGVVRLVRFDHSGVRGATQLDGVDPNTMSLGSDAVGAFVAWHARGKIRVRSVDGGSPRSLGRASRTETDATGHDGECAVAWSDGKDAVISRTPACSK
jgi:hypothetical protein